MPAGQLAHSAAATRGVLNAIRTTDKEMAQRLVWAMADPSVMGMRVPTQYPASTALVRNLMQFTVSSPTVAPPGFNTGDLLFALIGQPALELMYWTSLTAVTYDLSFASTVTASSATGMVVTLTPELPIATSGQGLPGEDYAWEYDFDPLAVVELGQLARVNMPVGEFAGRKFVFVNVNDVLKITLKAGAPSTAAGTIYYTVTRWGDTSAPKTYNTAVQTAAAAGDTIATLQVNPNTQAQTTGGWYRISLVSYRSSAANVLPSLTYTGQLIIGAAPGWKLMPAADLLIARSGDPLIGNAVRSAGSSLLITNTTSLLNRQGTVLAARMVGEDPVSEMTANDLQATALKYAGDAALGCYTFKELVQYNDDFRSVSDPSGGYLTVPLSRVGDYTHFIQVSCPSAATAANTYSVSVGYALEFKTQCPRYQQQLAEGKWTDVIEARNIVAGVPVWFYENPQHMAALYNLAKSVYRGMMHAVPYATKVGRVLAPEFSPVYAGLDYLASRAGQ